mmetsp:Transcript_25492/g.33307  ORF Transcript_25492/g.33307 Transcript_25492/m.33307 type:complete len:87 (+) Transcript_25492:24-284(+)
MIITITKMDGAHQNETNSYLLLLLSHKREAAHIIVILIFFMMSQLENLYPTYIKEQISQRKDSNIYAQHFPILLLAFTFQSRSSFL